MKENPKFIGRHYSKSEEEGLKKALQSWSEEELKPVEGELEKNREEVAIIKTINSMIENELKSLGVKEYEQIPLEKIHILSGEVFNEKFSDYERKASFIGTSDVVYLNKEKTDTKARFFSTLLHELIHRASKNKFYVDKKGGIHDARVGYRVWSPWKIKERENRLKGFNEIMVDYTVYKILSKNQKTLEANFGVTKEDILGPIYTYMNYAPILQSIVRKIAVDKGISEQEAFDSLERGQFAQTILVLKEIEHSFGKGSLAILSLLETLKKNEDNKKLETMIKKFFSEEDESKRQSLKVEIEDLARNSWKT